MPGTFSQHQHLASFAEGNNDFANDGAGAIRIIGQIGKHILNPGVIRQLDFPSQQMRHDHQVMRRTGSLGRGVTNRPALHEYDRLLAVATEWCGGEPENVFCFDAFENAFKRYGANVVALVDNHVTIVFDQFVDVTSARQ